MAKGIAYGTQVHLTLLGNRCPCVARCVGGDVRFHAGQFRDCFKIEVRITQGVLILRALIAPGSLNDW